MMTSEYSAFSINWSFMNTIFLSMTYPLYLIE